MRKALITASVYGFIGSFEKSNIKILLEQGYEVHVASNMSKDLKAFGDVGQLDGIDVVKHQISYNRSPLSLQTLKSYKEIKKLIKEENFNLIHCHTPVAAMLTRVASMKLRKKGTKVIYTAHGFHFFKGAPILNWLIYFPVEFICSFFTDILITINQEDYKLAQKVMKCKNVEYIPGVGVDINRFKDIEVDKNQKRKEIGIPDDSIMLLSVGELNKNKNHEVIIQAMSILKNSNIHYCIAGQGELNAILNKKSKVLSLQEQVHLLGYRNDVAELYAIADIFCFPSYREGLSVALMEALASGLPVIASNIRGNIDLVSSEGGVLFNPQSANECADAILNIINLEDKDEIRYFNIKKMKNFSKDIVNTSMSTIYRSTFD